MGDQAASPPDEPKPPRLLERIPHGVLHDGDAILERFLGWVEDIGLEPYPAQEEALLELMTGRHVVLATPTGSGKSLVALGLHFKAMCEGRRSFYTAPIKALVSEKFFALCDELGAENVGMLTGDASINWAAPVLCCTAEILANMALRQGDSTDAPYVVMDEFHYYADRDRGSAWQIPLITLRHTHYLLMSATLGNTARIERHIEETTGREIAHVHSLDRPVPLDFTYLEKSVHEAVEELLRHGKAPIYIVQFTQREASELAQALTSANVSDRDEKSAITEALADFRFDTPYGKDVQRFLKHGIGVHHAGLLPKYRLLVERLSQRGLLKVICGTDTLGVGVNIPIRTVLFTKLCKFDGEKVAILPTRDFKQIAGRAGRKGFDDAGSVVCLAPEHVVENRRLEARASGGGRKKKVNRRKPPTRGFVAWNAETFERLSTGEPETLRSSFRITHGLLVNCLQSEAASGARGGGYRRLIDLIDRCHEDAARKRRLVREAAVLFRALRRADVVEVVKDEHGHPSVQVHGDLQEDFSLHHSLSLYLVDAALLLERNSETYALDLLTLVEAVLENPRAILIQQERRAKSDLIARLKAERVPYEERMAKVEKVTWPKPNADFIYATFNEFAERHPWVGSENIRPKSIARELCETFATFHDYVRRYELARMEGVLLRYLAQVHATLLRTVPEVLKTDEVHELTAFLRAMIGEVDSSLVKEWELLLHPSSTPPPPTRDAEPVYDLANDAPALRARIRAELHALVRDLASGDFAGAASRVRSADGEPWDADRLEAEVQPFLADNERVVFDPRARQAHRTLIKQQGPRRFEVHQVLVDATDENLWSIQGEIDLREPPEPGEPLLRLRRISE